MNSIVWYKLVSVGRRSRNTERLERIRKHPLNHFNTQLSKRFSTRSRNLPTKYKNPNKPENYGLSLNMLLNLAQHHETRKKAREWVWLIAGMIILGEKPKSAKTREALLERIKKTLVWKRNTKLQALFLRKPKTTSSRRKRRREAPDPQPQTTEISTTQPPAQQQEPSTTSQPGPSITKRFLAVYLRRNGNSSPDKSPTSGTATPPAEAAAAAATTPETQSTSLPSLYIEHMPTRLTLTLPQSPEIFVQYVQAIGNRTDMLELQFCGETFTRENAIQFRQAILKNPLLQKITLKDVTFTEPHLVFKALFKFVPNLPALQDIFVSTPTPFSLPDLEDGLTHMYSKHSSLKTIHIEFNGNSEGEFNSFFNSWAEELKSLNFLPHNCQITIRY